MNPTEVITRSKALDKLLRILPDDPVLKAQYMYYLSIIIFIGLLGFSIATWYVVFVKFDFVIMFRGVFMTAISLMSLFSVKALREAFLTLRSVYSNMNNQPKQEIKLESVDEMMDEFK